MDLNSPWKLEFALLCPSVLPLSLSLARPSAWHSFQPTYYSGVILTYTRFAINRACLVSFVHALRRFSLVSAPSPASAAHRRRHWRC